MKPLLLPPALTKKLDAQLHAFAKKFKKKLADIKPLPGDYLEDFVARAAQEFQSAYMAEVARITALLTTEERVKLGDAFVRQHVEDLAHTAMLFHEAKSLPFTGSPESGILFGHLVGGEGGCGDAECPDCGGHLPELPGGNPAHN